MGIYFVYYFDKKISIYFIFGQNTKTKTKRKLLTRKKEKEIEGRRRGILSLSLGLGRSVFREINLQFCAQNFLFSASLDNALLLITFMSLPTKRSATATANSAASSVVSSSPTSTASISSPPMKKTKSQPVTTSLDPNKNGLHHHERPSSNINPSLAADDSDFDPSSMALDEDLKPDDSPLIGASRAVATNLSRKKATPPQPAKKLVIKLVKGPFF